ncbi:response regulator [Methanofollis ethanolicus]|uniref:response regulator n=1 Tax=Methanofollis ethanolicus TaxID=488124 RepID=UPI0008323037|nr:response regulator [Methanofollis ethanolicus]
MPRILITDDSSFQRKIISSILDKEGFETVCARNGREGLDLAAENPPDLIVLDLLMPEMDGFEMMKQLRERGLTAPVIILTADIQESTLDACRKMGARACLNKPLKKDDLLATIRDILDQGGI